MAEDKQNPESELDGLDVQDFIAGVTTLMNLKAPEPIDGEAGELLNEFARFVEADPESVRTVMLANSSFSNASVRDSLANMPTADLLPTVTAMLSHLVGKAGLSAMQSAIKPFDQGGWAPRPDDVETVKSVDSEESLPDYILRALETIAIIKNTAGRAVRLYLNAASNLAFLDLAATNIPPERLSPELAEGIKSNRPEWSKTQEEALLLWQECALNCAHTYAGAADAIRSWRDGRLSAKRGGSLPARPVPLPDTFHWSNGNINRLAVEAIAHADNMESRDGLAYGYYAEAKDLRATFGLPNGPTSDTLWDCLCQRGAAAVKMHYVLWARWYDRPDKQNPWLFLNIPQVCQDAGYTRHHKGGFKQRDKHAVWQVLDALTAVEVRAIFTPPNAKGKEVLLTGRLWARDVNARLQDRFGDLYGHAREGDPATWEPLTFAYQPGAWFYNREWEARNRFVGMASSGLMQLDANRDEWAVLLGGYLITLARTGGYSKTRIRVSTILQRTNLAQDKNLARRKTQYQTKFETAMNRLAEVGIVLSWNWDGGETKDIEDWDDPNAIADYYREDAPVPPDDWRARKIVVTWPNTETDAPKFKANRRKAIALATRKKARKQT